MGDDALWLWSKGRYALCFMASKTVLVKCVPYLLPFEISVVMFAVGMLSDS